MKRKLISLGGLLILMLSACGGGEGGDYSSASDVAQALQDADLGCDDLTTREQPFVEEAGTCSVEGEEIAIAIFNDQKAQDDWVKTLGSFSTGLGSALTSVTGNGWAVIPESPEVAEQIQGEIGGELTEAP